MNGDFSPGRFDGKTVIVTGAGSGIGRATGLRLLREGARVIATDLIGQRLDALADTADGELVDGELITITADIGASGTAEALVTAAAGRIDGLANVAGIMDGFLPPAEIDDAVWDLVMNVNVTAIMRTTRAVLPLMLAAKSGSIVNVSSEAGLRGSAAGAAYTTSKHAVVGFTRSTAFFYTPIGVRCNSVAPGGVATNIEAPFKSAFAGQRLGPIMQAVVPPLATPEQLAASICWLLSDDSANVSGAILPNDGGWAAI